MNRNSEVVPVYTGIVARWQVSLLRASPAEHHSVHDMAKVFFTFNFSYLRLAIPPLKLKLGQQIGGGLLIANHMDQLLWWANQKHWAAVRSYLVHSFLQRAPRCLLCRVPATADCEIMLHQNHFGICHVMCTFWHFFIDFSCAGSHNGHRWERETCQPYKGKPASLPSWWREGWQV